MFDYPSDLEQYQFWWMKALEASLPWEQSLNYMLGQHLGIKAEFPWGACMVLRSFLVQLNNSY